MFSFPEGPQPVSHAEPGLEPAARLVVEVPHWTSVITIVDNDLQAVTGLSKLEPLSDDWEGAFAVIDLPAGAYNIEARLGGNTQSMWVVAPEGQVTRVPAAMWDRLALATSMPLATAIAPRPADDPAPATAHHLSRMSGALPPGTAPSPDDARLFLFGRLTGTMPMAARNWDIELIAETGASVVKLTDQPPRVEADFWSCSIAVPKG